MAVGETDVSGEKIPGQNNYWPEKSTAVSDRHSRLSGRAVITEASSSRAPGILTRIGCWRLSTNTGGPEAAARP